MASSIDLIGKKFGRWTVLELSERKNGRVAYKCRCNCGTIRSVLKEGLIAGSKSCGCRRKEITTKHGMYGTKEYKTWLCMKQRCNNPNNDGYKYYGARNIKICKRWLDFGNFFKDMGFKPKGLTLERKNNELGYYKENCKWATITEQNQHKRLYEKNSTGVAGISWYESKQKYRVAIYEKNKYHHIGFFKTIKEATTARRQAEQKYWGKITNEHFE
uniref:AP2/ERF domain-containing protein n=1 Tax=viral metagenome TaxID=1070528 RepID=A0A6M3LW59_9ZZZZ